MSSFLNCSGQPSNIGVGYDTLGLAFNLRAKITFRESPTLIIDGCPEQFRNDDNLVWTSYVRACEKLGEEPTPKHITIDSPIPLSGGLGSSSTCVIAGIAAAMTESHGGWDPFANTNQLASTLKDVKSNGMMARPKMMTAVITLVRMAWRPLRR